MVHPTLVIPFPGLPEVLVRQATPLWKERLGPRFSALEATPPDGLERALTALLAQPRQLELRRMGIEPTPDLTLVALAQAEEPSLPQFLEEMAARMGQGPWAGMEVRVHLVLFLQGPKGLEALQALPPNPLHQPPTRVWPVSRWGSNGLYLPKEEHLLVWVQHFVEALVASQAPLHPERGRDWVGLGIARLELERPSPETLVAPLWEAMRTLRLGPAPDIPAPPSRVSPSLSPPPFPQRRSCEEHPNWIGASWEAYRKEMLAMAAQAGEEVLVPLEAPTPYELGRQALLLGLPALEETLHRLQGEMKEVEARRAEVLEVLDRTLGVAEKRARLRRLRERVQRGSLRGRDDLEREIRELEEKLLPVDRAIQEGNIGPFVQADAEAREAEQALADLEQEFQANRERWAQGLENQPAKPEPFWKRWIQALWTRLRRTPSPGNSTLDQARLRKRLCDRAWHLLQEAQAFEEKRTQRHLHYEEVLHRFTLYTAYLQALRREHDRAQRALALATGFQPLPTHPEDNPLVVRIPRQILPNHPAVQGEARLLLKEGALEALWDQDVQGLERRLHEAAGRLAEALGSVPLTPPDENLWSTLVTAASPRVLVRNWPEHRRYAYVLGPGPAVRWGEACDDEEWLRGESVLFRMVFPLAPDHLMEDTPLPPPLEESSPPAPPSPRQDEVVVRENPLLDELLT